MVNLNLFLLRDPPKVVYLYNIEYIADSQTEEIKVKKRISSILGIFYDNNRNIGYSLLPPDIIESIKEKYKELLEKENIVITPREERIKLTELKKEIQEQIVQLFIKIKYSDEIKRLKDILTKKRRNELNSKKYEDLRRRLEEKGFYLSKVELQWDVIKIKDKFYMIINFKHKFRSKWYLSKFVNKESITDSIARDLAGKKKMFENISGKYFEVDCTNLSIDEVKEKILEENEDKIKDIIKYHKEKYPDKIKEIENLEKEFKECLYKQPIIKGHLIKGLLFVPKQKEKARLLPMFLREVLIAEDNPDVAEIIRGLDKFWKIDLKERLKIIKESIEEANLSFIESYEPLDLKDTSLDSRVVVVRVWDRAWGPIKEKVLKIDLVARVTDFFIWTFEKKAKKIYGLYDIPDYIKKIEKIPVIIIVDKNCWCNYENVIREFIESLIEKRYNKLRTIEKNLPYLDYNYEENTITKYELNKNNVPSIIQDVERILNNKYKNYNFALSLIFGKKLPKIVDYYDSLEKELLDINVIPQNFLMDKLIKYYKYYKKVFYIFYIHNTLLNILAKIGIKPFSVKLPENIKYDYILGLDVGVDRYGSNRIAGVTVVFDSKGIIKKVKTFEVPLRGESLDEEDAWVEFASKLVSSLNLYSKKETKILIIRDGNIYSKERSAFKKITAQLRDIEITLINVIKRHPIFIADKKSNIALEMDGRYLLLAHSYQIKNENNKYLHLQRPIKVSKKYIYKNGEEKEEQISKDDIRLLFNLTRLNYSMLFSEGKSNLRLPAPVYYADKFVKALKEGKRIRNRDLEEIGALYFI